jgi:hypothetical protein
MIPPNTRLKQYQNFVTTGCSFTAGVISKPNDTLDAWQQKSSVWPHYCFLEMDPPNNTFTNLAMPGSSNISAFSNLIYFLETNKEYTPENTLVGFNLTSLSRIDEICDVNDPRANKDLCCIEPEGLLHPSQSMGFSWITRVNDYALTEYTHPEILNMLAVVNGITYLEANNFDYFFMLMIDEIFTESPTWFQEFLTKYSSRWVKFDNALSMFSFVDQRSLTISEDDQHPSRDGHKLIAETVLNFIR